MCQPLLLFPLLWTGAAAVERKGDQSLPGSLSCARDLLWVPQGHAGSRHRQQCAGAVLVPGVAPSNAGRGTG